LGAALRECVDLIQPLAAQRQVRIEADTALQHPGYVLADQQRLRQVVLNILTNAVKYNREAGSIALSIAELGPRVRIQVLDTGLGLAPEQVAKLFTPFERLGAEQTGVEGTGLGLALSQHLVEAMQGRIGVESAVGQGSTFWIELTTVESPLQQLPNSPRDHRILDPPAIPAQTILYIEDNLSNLKLIEGILETRPGIRLLTAMQGQLGIEMARAQQPDLILLDLHLPDLTGDVVLQRLQDDVQTRSIPVIMVSADALPHQIERLRAAGARAYLTKPLAVKTFLQTLDETLQ